MSAGVSEQSRAEKLPEGRKRPALEDHRDNHGKTAAGEETGGSAVGRSSLLWFPRRSVPSHKDMLAAGASGSPLEGFREIMRKRHSDRSGELVGPPGHDKASGNRIRAMSSPV